MASYPMVAASFVPVILLGISAIYDLCCRRVPNYLTGIAAIIGLSYPWFMVNGIGLSSAYLGGVLGLFILLPPYILGLMGAGDVKALAVAGLFVGIEKIFILALYIALAGGVLALIYWFRRSISQSVTERNASTDISSYSELPYVVAIFGGFFYMLISESLT